MRAIDPAEWRRVKAIAADAAALPLSTRASYIDSECAGDDLLRLEVESLVGAMDHATGLYECPSISIPGHNPLNDFVEPLPESSRARVGAYRLLAEIGRGGMGTVYLAERDDGEFEQRVAIKTIRRGMDSAAVIQRFRH